jgi:hypothetical protein
MQQNLFIPENVPALRAIGCVEGNNVFTEWRYPESRLTLGIDSNGVLMCESMHGLRVTVRINDAINSANNAADEEGRIELHQDFVDVVLSDGTSILAADEEGRMELHQDFVDVVLSDGTSIICDGALYPSRPQIFLNGVGMDYDWFWLEVCQNFSENAIQIVR